MKIKSSIGELEFENGSLVKIAGVRPSYMDGHALIRAVCGLAKELEKTRYNLQEVIGTSDEYFGRPCLSLEARHRECKQKAREEIR